MHSRTVLSTTAMILLATCVIGCSDPKPGMAVTHDTLCKKENDQKRVTLAGYLAAGGFMTMCSPTCSMKLRKDRDDPKSALTVSLRPGGGKNRMDDLPKRFKKEDLKVTTNDGKVVGYLGHIKVTGKALIGEKSCQIVKVDLIEAI